MVNILPVASGKGGVGKSAVSVNLALSLAEKGKKIALCDFDLGGANLHTLLGLKNNSAGLGNFIYHQVPHLETLMQDTGIENLFFIAGDCLFPGTPNLDFFTKKKLMKEISLLPVDYAILDLGGGSTYNILDFYLMTHTSLLVTTAEITSILNAYSFLKAAAFRFLTRQFPAKSQERQMIQDGIQSNTKGSEYTVSAVLDEICSSFPESGEKARKELSLFCPQVILNMGQTSQDLEMGRRLRSLVQHKLNLKLDFIGFLPKDEVVPLAVARRTPVYLLAPNSRFTAGIHSITERVLAHEYGFNDILEQEENINADLDRLQAEFSAESEQVSGLNQDTE